MTAELAGVSVLVTRPREHAAALSQRLSALGAAVTRLPLYQIEPVALDAGLREALREAASADWVLFASRPAVRFGLARLRELDLWLAPNARVATVGPGTAADLAAAGVAVHVQPESGFTSEALLALPELQNLAGQRAAIFRGVGGRELIAATLAERGANVRFVEVYRRRPVTGPVSLGEWPRMAERQVLVTSLQGLATLTELVGSADRGALLSADLITVSERIAEAARDLGYRGRVLIASRPDDDGLVEAALSLRKQEEQDHGRIDR